MSFIPLSKVKKNGKVDLWDMGPPRPDLPPEPIAPDKAKLKGGELAAAEVAYEDDLVAYKDELREHARLMREYRDWHKDKGGPVRIEQWGIDARHSLEREPKRYCIDLPADKKPGKAQREAEEQALAEMDALQRAHAADPQFGQGAAA